MGEARHRNSTQDFTCQVIKILSASQHKVFRRSAAANAAQQVRLGLFGSLPHRIACTCDAEPAIDSKKLQASALWQVKLRPVRQLSIGYAEVTADSGR